jgi:hypothetical protein
LFASHALWQLPTLPNEGGPLGVRLLGDYLGFGPTAGPGAPD